MRAPVDDGEAFPRSFKQAVLTGKKRFQVLFEKGKPTGGPGIRLLAYKTDTGEPTLLAVCVSKRTGNAVERNRLKRITREALASHLPRLLDGYYVALFPSKGFDRQDFARRVESLRKLFKNAGLFGKST